MQTCKARPLNAVRFAYPGTVDFPLERIAETKLIRYGQRSPLKHHIFLGDIPSGTRMPDLGKFRYSGVLPGIARYSGVSCGSAGVFCIFPDVAATACLQSADAAHRLCRSRPTYQPARRPVIRRGNQFWHPCNLHSNGEATGGIAFSRSPAVMVRTLVFIPTAVLQPPVTISGTSRSGSCVNGWCGRR
jgi:hypothetical protein